MLIIAEDRERGGSFPSGAQNDDALVSHVVECTMEENVEVVRLTPQECFQCTVEEIVDSPVAPNSAHSAGGPGRFKGTGHAAVCPSRQLASSGVRVLTMFTVVFFEVCEIVLGGGVAHPMLGATRQ